MIRLHELKMGKRTFTSESHVKTTDVGDEIAISKLVSGQAKLAPSQPNPPFSVLKFIEERISNLVPIGPPLAGTPELTSFFESILSNGHFSPVFRGQLIEFVKAQELVAAYQKHLGLGQLSISLATEMFQKLHEARIAESEFAGTFPAIDDEERLDQGIIGHGPRFPPNSDDVRFVQQRGILGEPRRPELQDHYKVGPDWAHFKSRAGALREDLYAAIILCLQEQRILAFENLGQLTQPVNPSQFSSGPLKLHKWNYVFVFSSTVKSAIDGVYDPIVDDFNHAEELLEPELVSKIDRAISDNQPHKDSGRPLRARDNRRSAGSRHTWSAVIFTRTPFWRSN